MRIGYGDPPYPGCAHLYRKHPDFAGEVDHRALIAQLEREYDGWVLHTHSPALRDLLPLCPPEARVHPWIKPFASFKPTVAVCYAWEPIIIKPARRPVVNKRMVFRDYIECPMTMKKGLAGVKPPPVCHYAFECVGALPGDDLHDMFPGSGAVLAAWETWVARALEGVPSQETLFA